MDKHIHKETQDFLIRGVPSEIIELLQQRAKDNHRSKTQEAIVILTEGVKTKRHSLQQPKPFEWKTKMSSEFIQKAIEEGRE